MQDNWDTLQCTICSEVFYEPISLFCGHTFCRSCLIRSMNYNGTCPLCREILHIDPYTAAVSNVLLNVIQQLLPEKYEERRKEFEEEDTEHKHFLPLFVLTCGGFPSEILPLRIFEPRYRLMLSRVSRGSGNFGLVGAPGGQIQDFGVVLKIMKLDPLGDGQSLIITMVKKRFTIDHKKELDGYLVGSVQYFSDEPINEEDLPRCKELFTSLETQHKAFVDSLPHDQRTSIRERAHHRPAITLDRITTENSQLLEDYSFWLCSFLNVSERIYSLMVSSKQTKERLVMVHRLLTHALCDSGAIPAVAPAS